jgi:hypothetical protein
MHYMVLCYDSEDVVCAWTKEQEATAMEKLGVVRKKLKAEGKLVSTGRLMPTTAATTLRKGKEAVILDGPFAETKEQLLGYFLLECKSLEDAHACAKELAAASSSAGAFEVRPMLMFSPDGVNP